MDRVLYDIKGNARRQRKIILDGWKEEDLYSNLP
jgi:hypothetical protein